MRDCDGAVIVDKHVKYNYFYRFHLCTYEFGKGHCGGDSGGPLFLKVGYRNIMIGVGMSVL